MTYSLARARAERDGYAAQGAEVAVHHLTEPACRGRVIEDDRYLVVSRR